MWRMAGLAAALLTLSACEIRSDDEAFAAPLVSPCEPVVFESTALTLCTLAPSEHRIRTRLALPQSDVPLRSLSELRQSLSSSQRARTVLAMNGGMFDDDGQPIGYYVEDGRRLMQLNRNEGPGNFHLLPNGIFFGLRDGGWQVLSADAFAQQVSERPYFATQSGPMLVIDGRLHPAITNDGTSRYIRNAVGIDAHGRALFAISEEPVSFGKLARFYRDVLGARNALFLDGSVSQLWDPANGRLDDGAALGPLIVAENRAEAAQ